MALTPVISIPVDSSEFDKFAAAFGDYQQKLKEMPADWQATNTRIKELAAVQTALGVSADRAWSNATSAAMAYERTVKSAVTAQSSLAQTGLGAANTMRKMAAEARHMSESLFNVVRSITSFTTLGIGGGLLGLGGLTFGLDRLADSVLNRQSTAQGLGLTVGQYNSFKANMAQYAGLNVLQGAAGAKYDMSKWGYLTSLGVNLGNVQHEDATQIAAQEIWAIHQAWKQNPTMQSTPALSALKLGMSESDVIRIGRAPDAPLRAALARLQPDASTLGFTAQVAQEWSAFSIQLHKAGIQIETALIDTLTPLTPQLTKLSRETAALIVGLEKSGEVKAWVNDLAGGIKTFSQWLGSPAFQQDMRTMAYYFAAIAHDVGAVARFFVGPVPGPPSPLPPGAKNAPQQRLNNFLNMKAPSGGWATFDTSQQATAKYMALLDYGKPYQNKSVAQQVAVWNGNGPNSAEYAQNVSVWAGQALGLNHPLALNKAFAQYSPQYQAAILASMSRMEGERPMTAAQLLPAVVAWDKTHGYATPPTIPAGVVPKAPAAPPGGIFPGGTSTAPTGGDLDSVLKNLRKITASKTTVTINNNTAAQVHVSTNAAAGG